MRRESESPDNTDTESEVSSISSDSSTASSLESLRELIRVTEADIEAINEQILTAFNLYSDENSRLEQEISETQGNIERLSDDIETLQALVKEANPSIFDRPAINAMKNNKNKLQEAQAHLVVEQNHLRNLISAQELDRQHHDDLIGQRNDFIKKLTELKAKEEGILSGKISELGDDISVYSADSSSEVRSDHESRAPSPEIPLISSYVEEKPGIEARLSHLK